MNHKNLVKKSSEKSTRAELFVQATQIIEQARPKKGRKTDDVDTVSARGKAKRAADRAKIVSKYQADEGLQSVSGGSVAPEGQKVLSEAQEQQKFADVVREILKHFRQDKSEFAIIVAVVRHNIDYCDHKALAEHCKVAVKEVRRARGRIQYYVKTRYPDGLDSIE